MKSDVKNYLEYKFEKLKILQKTDKSEIVLAQSRATQKLVVIKFLKSVGLPYNKLRKISHSLWAKILYCAEDSTDTVIVEEFLQGESLFERLEQKKFLSADEARNILIQLCDGLKILHENKIIHRDIKPSNLILQEGGIIRLIDFDAARIFDAEKNKDTHFLGTKGYAPPEQFGYGQTDARSDIFSLGLTLFEMLGNNCDSSLKKILSKCTELDPKNRFQSVEELKSALIEKSTRSYTTMLASVALMIVVLAGILFFVNSTADKDIPALPAQVDEHFEEVQEEDIPVSENPANTEKKNVEEKISNETFQFPEIKLPQQSSSPVQSNSPIQNLPQPISNLPPITTKEETPPPDEKISEPEEVPKQKDYVKVKYWIDGRRSAEWTDNFESDITNAVHGIKISENAWSQWKSAGNGAIFFPDAEIYIEAQNFSSATFTNPQVKLIYDDNGRKEEKTFYGASSIAPGETISFTIPIGNFRIDNPHAAKDYWMSLHNFEVYFSGNGAKIIGSKMTYDFGLISQKRWDQEYNTN